MWICIYENESVTSLLVPGKAFVPAPNTNRNLLWCNTQKNQYRKKSQWAAEVKRLKKKKEKERYSSI